MTFISYAQNFEDVILWRALRDVQAGFYIDVGAADPEEHSVTKAFYERGWAGINIEPSGEHYAKLVEARPNDLNLRLVVGREAGVTSFNVIEGTGLSTLDQTVAERHREAGWTFRPETIPVLTLTQICDSHPRDVVHFLKIDVEGAEAEVLAGLDLGRIRPWIIVVEATEPLSTTSTRDQWEHLLTGHGYEFVYFDGLNCFYVAPEQPHLKKRFSAPPNVFDDFLKVSEWRAQQEAAQRGAELDGMRGHAQGFERRVMILEQEIVNRDRALQDRDRALAEAAAHHNTALRKLKVRLSDATARTTTLENQLLREREHASDLKTMIDGLREELQRETDRASSLEYRLRATYLSDSWRMTRPVRLLSRSARRIVLAAMGKRTDHLLALDEEWLAAHTPLSPAAEPVQLRLEQEKHAQSDAAGGGSTDPSGELLPHSARRLFRRIAAHVPHAT